MNANLIISTDADLRDYLVVEGMILGAPAVEFDVDAIVADLGAHVTYGTTTYGDLDDTDVVVETVAKHAL